MFDSVVIDVAIALGLVFFTFSLVVSGLRELVSRVLETRSKELWRSIRGLIDDPMASGLRELRAAAARLEGEAREGLEQAIASAESTLRSHLDSGDTGKGWKARVEKALAPVTDAVRTHAPGDNDLAKLVKITGARFTGQHASGRRAVFGLFRAGRRGGERPVVAEGAGPVGVPTLAAEVAGKARTLTDAIHDHPLVRQVDRTWPGFHSRMQRLESDDFSLALTDVIQAAGVEPALKSVFTDAARVINRLSVDDSVKQQLWVPVKQAWRAARATLDGTAPTVGHIDAVFASVRSSIDELVGGDGEEVTIGLSHEDHAALASSLEEARSAVTRFVDDPLELVKAGADLLDDSVPIKQMVQRFAVDAERNVENAAARLAVMRQSLGGWYDSRMDALSAWYRKRTRFVSFALGLVVAVAFNVDAVRMPQELWQNENVRGVVVALADQTGLDVSSCVQTDAAGGAAGTTDSQTPEECVEDRVDQLVETGLPVGWDWATTCDGDCGGLIEHVAYASGLGGEGGRAGLLKIGGWLAAAAALSMGAPFWYDVLRRATGIKQRAAAARKQASGP